jgi:hypothetical protein
MDSSSGVSLVNPFLKKHLVWLKKTEKPELKDLKNPYQTYP